MCKKVLVFLSPCGVVSSNMSLHVKQVLMSEIIPQEKKLHAVRKGNINSLAFFQKFFFRGRAKSIVSQISITMRIFLLFSDKISEGRLPVE